MVETFATPSPCPHLSPTASASEAFTQCTVLPSPECSDLGQSMVPLIIPAQKDSPVAARKLSPARKVISGSIPPGAIVDKDHTACPNFEQTTPGAILPATPRRLIDEVKYSVKQSAGKLGVSPSAVRTLISRGDLSALLIGKKHVIPESVLERYLEGRWIVQRSIVPVTKPGLPESVLTSPHLKR